MEVFALNSKKISYLLFFIEKHFQNSFFFSFFNYMLQRVLFLINRFLINVVLTSPQFFSLPKNEKLYAVLKLVEFLVLDFLNYFWQILVIKFSSDFLNFQIFLISDCFLANSLKFLANLVVLSYKPLSYKKCVYFFKTLRIF